MVVTFLNDTFSMVFNFHVLFGLCFYQFSCSVVCFYTFWYKNWVKTFSIKIGQIIANVIYSISFENIPHFKNQFILCFQMLCSPVHC